MSRQVDLALAGAAWVIWLVAIVAPTTLSSPGIGPLVWSLSVITVGRCAWRLAGRLCEPDSIVLRFVIAAFLFEAMASSAVALLGLATSFTLTVVLAIVAGIATFSLTWLRPASIRARLRIVPSDFGAIGQAAVVLSALAWIILSLNHLRYTAQDADSMFYHLPMVAEWILTGSTQPIEAIREIARGYPGFKEGVLAFLSVSTRTDRLALINIVEIPLFAATIVLLSRRYSTSSTLPVAAGVYVLTTPLVHASATVQGTDVALALNFSLALLFALRFSEAPAPKFAVLTGLALGALAATKYSGVIYAGVLALVFLVRFVAARDPRRRATASGSLNALLVLSGVILLAGPWYVRNLVMYGNPLYPARIELGTRVIFDGSLGREFFAPATLGWNLTPLLRTADYFPQAFGALIPLVALAPLGLASTFLTKDRERKDRPVLIILSLLSFIVFLHQPFNMPDFGADATLRYLLPWFVVGVVGAVAYLGGRPRLEYAGAALLLAGTVMNLALWTRWWVALVMVTLAVTAASRLTKAADMEVALPRRLRAAISVGVIVLTPVAATVVEQLRAHLERHADYGYHDTSSDRGWGAISTYVRTRLTRSRIIVHGGANLFPLYGAPFSNHVFSMLDPRGTDGAVSPEAVVAYARTTGAEYVVSFVPTTGRRGLYEYTFGDPIGPSLLAKYPDIFTLEFENRGAQLLRVHPTVRSSGLRF